VRPGPNDSQRRSALGTAITMATHGNHDGNNDDDNVLSSMHKYNRLRTHKRPLQYPRAPRTSPRMIYCPNEQYWVMGLLLRGGCLACALCMGLAGSTLARSGRALCDPPGISAWVVGVDEVRDTSLGRWCARPGSPAHARPPASRERARASY
jgi:hypothetical protein